MRKDTLKKMLESGQLASMIAEAVTGEQLTTPDALWNYLKPYFAAQGDNTVERFVCVFLNAKNRVISIETVATGTITGAAVYPREILKQAFAIGASAVIFAHNHPSGDTEPSLADRALTKKLVFACKSIDITVFDHMILGGNEYFSFANDGLIAHFNTAFNSFMEGD